MQSHDAEYRESGAGWATKPSPPVPLDGDLRDRIEHAMRTTAVSWSKAGPLTEHGMHNFESGCALCHGDAPSLTDAVLAVVQPLLAARDAEIQQLRAALSSIESLADRAHRKGYDLDAEEIRSVARTATAQEG